MGNTSAKFWKQPVFFLVVIGILFAFAVHFLEIKTTHLSANLHETADDASYLRPAENLASTGIWKDNSVGPSSYVQRPPIVGIVHFIGLSVFQTKSAWFIFFVALLLHGVGIGHLYKLILQYSNKRNALFFTLVFITTPCFWGFLSYSISEAFLVSSIIITTKIALSQTPKSFYKFIVALCLLYFLRPVLLLFFFPLFLFKIRNYLKEKHYKGLLSLENIALKSVVFISLGTIFFWEMRKFHYTDTFSPHPIYHAKNESIFREPHEKLTELFKIWEVQPEVFHAILGREWSLSLSDKNELKRYIEAKEVPVKVETLQLLLVKFTRLKSEDYSRFDPRARPIIEHRFGVEVENTQKQVISENRLHYWMKTPLLSAKENLFKSHLNLTIFQETYRGNVLMELWRISILALILLGFLSLVLVPFIIRDKILSKICLGSLLYFLFLIEYQRMNEDRYFLPLIVTGFICTAILTFRVSEHFKKRTN